MKCLPKCGAMKVLSVEKIIETIQCDQINTENMFRHVISVTVMHSMRWSAINTQCGDQEWPCDKLLFPASEGETFFPDREGDSVLLLYALQLLPGMIQGLLG